MPGLQAVKAWLPRLAGWGLAAFAVAVGIVALFALAGPHVGYSYAVVKSGSMVPAYPPGTIIVMEAVQPSLVRPGDAISFQAPGKGRDETVTHRVVAVLHEGGRLQFETKGDANEEPDGRFVQASELRGRVAFGVPWAGRLAPLVQQERLFFVIVFVSGGLFILMEAANIFRELRQPKTRRIW